MNLFAREREAEESSVALIANGRHGGCVLEYRGPGIEGEIDEAGCYGLDDLGLDDALEGLSVWEGKARYWKSGNPMDGEEWNGELVGQFRRLTEGEWERLARGKMLWPREPESPLDDACPGCGLSWARCDAIEPPAIKCCPDCQHEGQGWKAVAIKRAERIAQLKATLNSARAVLTEFDESNEPRSYVHALDALRRVLG